MIDQNRALARQRDQAAAQIRRHQEIPQGFGLIDLPARVG